MFFHKSLKFRLIFFICSLTLLVTLGLSQLVSQYSKQQIIKDRSDLLSGAAFSMAHNLRQDINTRASEIQFLTSMSLIKDPNVSLADKRLVFENMKSAYPYYAWLGMTDNKGNILTGTDGLLEGKNVGKRAWFIEGSKDVYFGDVHNAFLLEKLMPKPKWDDLPLRLVDVSAPIFDKQGNLLGVICGHLSIDWVYEVRMHILGNLSYGEVDLLVLNNKGQVLMGTPSLPSLQVDLSHLGLWKQVHAKDKQSKKVSIESWPDGKNYLSTAVSNISFNTALNMDWIVVARVSEHNAFQSANSVQYTILSWGLISAILLGFLIWLLITKELHPLEKISKIAEKLTHSQENIEIPQLSGQSEIGIFSRSLTELVHSLQQKNAQLVLSERVFAESSQGIIITNKDQDIIRVNHAFTDITKYKEKDVLGKKTSLLASGKHDKYFYQAMQHSLQEFGCWNGEIWNRNAKGEVYPEWLNIYVLKDKDGEITHYIGLFDDISEKKENEERLLHYANYDVLTNLPNRHLLQEYLKGSIEQIEYSDGQLALLFIDLDKFKHINDSLGHPVGDTVLKEVANRFLSVIEHGQTLARWGGDEFVVALPGADGMQAKIIGQKIINCLNHPFEISSSICYLNVSIGIALFPSDSKSVDGLLRCADTAMYKAKLQADNMCQLYEAKMNESVQQFLAIDNAIRQSLAKNGEGLSLVFQPQFVLDKSKIVGLEALIRWTDKELGFVSPADFIPVLEETKQIIRLGEWVVDRAISQMKTLQNEGYQELMFSINCSPHQILDKNFISHLITSCKKYQVTEKLIRIEVTESAIMSNEMKASSILKKARQLGFSVSIDDFGTGFSCLHYIQKIHPDEIKVDQSFVQLADIDEDSKNIVQFTVGLANSMELDIVAEGVETQAQLDVLKQMGDMHIQGYLYSKPLTFEQLKALLQKQNE